MVTLSDKSYIGEFSSENVYDEKDVKKFIRMLKYELANTDIIDKLAGPKLTEGPFT